MFRSDASDRAVPADQAYASIERSLFYQARNGRVHFGGALSGRDQNAVNKTISGLLKLIYPDPAAVVPDEDLEWAVRLGLEVRRRVKEQQKRIGSAEFRNTQFSYVMGLDGVEKFVATPELQARTASVLIRCPQVRYGLSAQAVKTKPMACSALR